MNTDKLSTVIVAAYVCGVIAGVLPAWISVLFGLSVLCLAHFNLHRIVRWLNSRD